MGNKPVKGVATAVDSKDAVPKAQMDTAISTAVAAVTTTSLGAVPTSRTISAGTNLSGGGDLSANRTISHATSGVTADTYTLATVTVDAQGHVTSASNGTASPFTETFKTSADQNVTSSTTFTNATDMSFSIAANTLTYFEFIIFGQGGPGAIKFAVNGPTLTSLRVAQYSGLAQTAYDTQVFQFSANEERMTVMAGLIECSAAGTVQLRFAQVVSNGTACTLRKGSRTRYATVA